MLHQVGALQIYQPARIDFSIVAAALDSRAQYSCILQGDDKY
jgi:hypothetical protein